MEPQDNIRKLYENPLVGLKGINRMTKELRQLNYKPSDIQHLKNIQHLSTLVD
jgi:isochorismate synthase EntC